MKNPLKMLKSYLKKILCDMHSIILHAILVSLGLGGAVIRLFFENVWISLKTTMLSTTPLWVTIAMVLVLLVYIYLKNKKSIPLLTLDSEYLFKFHVYWDKNNNMRCLACGNLLKCSSDKYGDKSTFFCSIKECNNKHVLRDKNGNLLTEQQAVDLIGKL